MLTTKVAISRSQFFWEKISLQMVEAYLKELNKMKETLKNFGFDYQHTLFGSEAMLNSVVEDIDTEIKYCEFSMKHQHRRENEPNFDQWVFTKKEDIKPRYDWIPPKGDQWTKTNGRIKATIEFDRSGVTTKISLNYENDSSTLTFLDQYHKQQRSDITHLRNEDSIKRKTEEFKAKAEAFLKKHEFPLYEPIEREMEILKKILCIS